MHRGQQRQVRRGRPPAAAAAVDAEPTPMEALVMMGDAAAEEEIFPLPFGLRFGLFGGGIALISRP